MYLCHFIDEKRVALRLFPRIRRYCDEAFGSVVDHPRNSVRHAPARRQPGGSDRPGQAPLVGPDGTQRVYLPVLGKNTSFLPPIIPETTNVLTSESTNQLASISEDGTTYTFVAVSSELQRVDVGDVIISGASDAAPYGFLRKVISRQTQGSGLKLVTEQATVEEAYQQVSVSLQQTLTPEGLQGFSALPGVTLVQSPNGVNAGDFKLPTE